MNFVEPIRDQQTIRNIKELLRKEKRYRDLLLLTIGINTALRISDLLTLKVGDFVDEAGIIKQKFSLQEKKRGKRQEVIINDSIRLILAEYFRIYPGLRDNPCYYLFFNTRTNAFDHPIQRCQAWNSMSTICRSFGLEGNFGTHSLRKTWGYQARRRGVDIALIMYKLNHASLAYTQRYLGVTSDELAAVTRKLNL